MITDSDLDALAPDVMNSALDTEFSAKLVEAFNSTGLPKEFRAKRGDNGVTIYLYDVIGTEECNAAALTAILDEADGAPITLRISSPGGSVFQGWNMANALERYEGDVNVVVDGVCASIATIIALAGDHVATADKSMWMTHQAWVAVAGNKDDLRDTIQVLDKIDQNLATIYANKTGKDTEYWLNAMAKETWFTSSGAKDIGLVDEICVATKKEARAEAAIDPRSEVNEDSAEVQASKLALAKALRVRRATIAKLL